MREMGAIAAPLSPASVGLPIDFSEQLRFAEFVATSDLVPKALQGKPANVFLVMQKALALNLAWDVAMSGIHVIDNKVTCGAKLLRVLLRKAGHDLDVHTINDKEAGAKLTLAHRRDRPIEVSYTIAEAQTAGLTNKQVWKSHVKSMLIAAVSRRAVDWHCPEVAHGLDLSDETLAETFGEPIRATSEVIRDEVPGEAAAGQPGGDDPEQAAALELITEALQITDVNKLTELGKKARSRGLLDVTVRDVVTGDGTALGNVTVKTVLLTLMEQLEAATSPAK